MNLKAYVANADNNAVGVIQIARPGRSEVIGFIPTGWYPSALALAEGGRKLYIGTGKGENSYSDIYGPGSPLTPGPGEVRGTVKSLLKGSVEMGFFYERTKHLRGR